MVLVIEMLLAGGSIPELAMRGWVLCKDTLRLFHIGLSNFPVMVAKPDERPANRNPKSALSWCD